MSFGGTVQSMIQSLRANARPKHKAYQDWNKTDKLTFQENKKLEFKTVSENELKTITTQYQAKTEKEKKRKFFKTILLVLLLIPLIVFIGFQFFFKLSQSNYQPYQTPAEEINKTEQITYLLNSGYEWLNKNHYKNARFQFNRVLEINQENKNAQYGLTASFVYECVLDNMNCSIAKKMIDEYLVKYGEDTSIDYLKVILTTKKIPKN